MVAKAVTDAAAPPQSFGIPETLSGRHRLRRVLVCAALASRVHLPEMRERNGSLAQGPGRDLRGPEMRPSNLSHGGHHPAPLEGAAAQMVLGRASDGHPFQWHLGPSAPGSARGHL